MKLYELKNIEQFEEYQKNKNSSSKSFRELGIEDLKVIVNKHCRNFLNLYKSRTPINHLYRGFNDLDSDCYELNLVPNKYDYKNYYKLLFNKILPSWENFPKFNKSLTTNTNQDQLTNYKKVFRVIPFDNVKYGVTPNTNIWNSFKIKDSGNIVYLSDFDSFLGSIFRNVFSEENKELLKDPKKVKELLLKFSDPELKDKILDLKKDFSDRKYVESYSYFLGDYFDNYQKFETISYIDFLNTKLDPSENGFSTLEYDQGTIFPKNREIYIEGTCILIDKKIKISELL